MVCAVAAFSRGISECERFVVALAERRIKFVGDTLQRRGCAVSGSPAA